jgi:non-canonical purine NTP pyrophosphatase (RdgB/HAM1 family)
MNDVTFITGNENKAKYLSELLGVDIGHRKLDLDEIQSVHPEEVVEHKVRQAYTTLQRPVLVEDTCMGLDELGGLPGPFIKFFIEQPTGAENICRMADGLASRRATATTTFGYYDGVEVKLFQNKVYGEVPEHPGKEVSGFGWDTVFVPDGYLGVIRSELGQEEYKRNYAEAKPIAAVSDFLTSLH